MSRLQKKCLIASAGMHALLCVILLVGPAFLSKKKPEPAPDFIELIPGDFKVTDAQTQGGGNPNVTEVPPPQPTPPPPPPPEQEPPKEEVRPPKPEPEKLQKPEEPKQVNKEAEIPEVKPTKPTVKPNLNPIPPKTPTADKKTSNDKPKVNLNPTVRKPTPSDKQAAKNTAADKQSQIWKEIAKNVGGASKAIASRKSTGTTVEMPGTGGEYFVNYTHLVKAKYDQAWLDPTDVSDENTNVKVEITVERSGNVINSRILDRSGNSAMDKSVQRALERVNFIAPFPEGSKEQQRTFILNFNLKAKRMTG